MRLGILKDIDWEYVGALLANRDDNDQAAFFKGFVEECKAWGTQYQIGVQLATVNRKLSQEDREVLSNLTWSEG